MNFLIKNYFLSFLLLACFSLTNTSFASNEIIENDTSFSKILNSYIQAFTNSFNFNDSKNQENQENQKNQEVSEQKLTCNAENYKDYIFSPRKVAIERKNILLSNGSYNWCDLTGADISNEDLSGAILSYLDLSYIKCENTNFDGVEFLNTNLSFANCKGATFRDANFQATNASKTNFSNTVWSETSRIDIYIEGEHNNPDFSNAKGLPSHFKSLKAY